MVRDLATSVLDPRMNEDQNATSRPRSVSSGHVGPLRRCSSYCRSCWPRLGTSGRRVERVGRRRCCVGRGGACLR